MSIIVVSNNLHLIESLRGIFFDWGLSPFFGCKGESDLRTLIKHSKKAVRVILLDADLPSATRNAVRECFTTEVTLRYATRGWILPSHSLASREVPSDFHFGIPRPFASPTLFNAIFRGAEVERLHRPLWIHLGNTDPDSMAILEGLHIQIAPSPEAAPLKAAIQPTFRLGVLLIQPEEISEETVGWLKRLRNTASGSQLLIVCLNQNPERIRPLRSLCQLYLPRPTDQSTWHRTLEFIDQRWRGSLEIAFRATAMTKALHSRQIALARTQLRALQKSHPDASETLIATGRLHEHTQNTRRAISAFKSALETDPCDPEIYAHLLTLYQPGSAENLRIRQLAQQYCPNCKPLQRVGEKSAAQLGMAEQ